MGAKKQKTKDLVDAVKVVSKASGWKNSGAFFFRSEGDVFCKFIVYGDVDDMNLTLRFKWRAFDEAFWALTGSPQLAQQPESFRARGAFVAPAWTIGDWSGVAIADAVAGADARVAEVVARSTTLDAHIALLDEMHAALLAKHPQASVTVDRQRVFKAALDDDAATGLALARARVDADDSGGFTIGGDSFYACAVQFFERRLRGEVGPVVVAPRPTKKPTKTPTQKPTKAPTTKPALR